MKQFDVVVIGGGHAGVEAAAASARMGAKTALVTMSTTTVGNMSCNPAVGGLGKGHLVREIDALDGLMGRAADAAGIHFRLLNGSKGPAVQGPRVQTDRKVYRESIGRLLASYSRLEIIEGEVTDIQERPSGGVAGVVLSQGVTLGATTVVLTAGTFLNGVIHIGAERRSGGRMGDRASTRLAQRLDEMMMRRGRLKTGTPPRLDGRTIDWSVLEMQPGDDDPCMLSFLSTKPELRQVSCGITQTNEMTHEIIRSNIHLSAMYGGKIEGVGPRYCPSIEDKVVRFAEKSSHQVFLEPEGLDDHTIYPNGISTSLPAETQEEYVRSIKGLERVEILQPGYAIEYDYFDPSSLTLGLETAREGLFFAGQINGTTGYEEAAAQGLLAGANAAARALGRSGILFSRTDSYLGVMIDDLVQRGVTEPYRMFTSRAEFRLALRCDNADQRLTQRGITEGLVLRDRRDAYNSKAESLAAATSLLERTSVSANDLRKAGIMVSQDGQRRSLYQAMAMTEVTENIALAFVPELASFGKPVMQQVKKDATYVSYIARQKAEVMALQRDEAIGIPSELDFHTLPGLSNELRNKLLRKRPSSIAEASRIEGMTPSALTLILAHCKKADRVRAG